MAVAFVLYEPIYDFLIQPYVDLAQARDLGIGEDSRLLVTDPLEGFGIRMKTSLYAGIAIAMPVILWQVWRFVTPGLYPHEKRYAIPFMRERARPVRARRRARVLHAAAGARVPRRHRRRPTTSSSPTRPPSTSS